ncbi:MAG TPA: alpha/beta hydrolase [Pyrinomonadaceae bacterium]
MTNIKSLMIIALLATWLCVPASAQIKENFVTVDKLRVHYIESGRGPAVVMIHGNAGSIEDFEFGVLQTLSSNYRVIAVDRPGHGKSDRPATANVEYQARLLHQVLLSLRVHEPVLVGHSWGAALALSYALQFPKELSAMILVAPAAYPDSGESRLLQALVKPPVLGDMTLIFGRAILGRQILRAGLSRAFSPQAVPEEYFKRVASSWLGRKQLKAYLDDESSLNASLKQFSKHYAEIDIPVVILTGDHDAIVSARENAYRLKFAIPQATLIEIKDTGHEIPQTHPESIASALGLITSTSASLTPNSDPQTARIERITPAVAH